MKIVIPTSDEKGLKGSVAEHFGRCSSYTFLDEKGRLIEVIPNISRHMGGSGLPPELMKKYDANVLLCRGLGPRALELCNQLEIEVYVYSAQTVIEIFKLWKDNKIKKASAEDVCDEHK